MRWMLGVTTTPERRADLLPKTVASLARAGFDQPRLFVDGPFGCDLPDSMAGFAITQRMPAVGAYANWLLGLWELYLRDCKADRYAIFEDDILACANLRQYLETCRFPPMGYLNLYTCSTHGDAPEGRRGWHAAKQDPDHAGKGALGLVFDRPGVEAMLQQQYLIGHPHNAKKGRWWTDGAVWFAMRNTGRAEWIHHPSLLQHVGTESLLGHKVFEQAASFPGEQFDAMELAHA